MKAIRRISLKIQPLEYVYKDRNVFRISLRTQIDEVNWKEIGISEVSKISLEYITVKETSGEMTILPIWRMELGRTEEERILNRNRIIGVHAVTGELIQELTGMGRYN